MNRNVIRGALLLALLISVAVRFQTNHTREAAVTEFDVGVAIAEVLHGHGLQLLENPVKPPRVLAVVVYFQRLECDRASLVLPYFFNAEAGPLLARVTGPGFDHHFYYLDGSWREQRRVSMFLKWAKYAALDLFGASPYVLAKKAIVLGDPPNCHPAEIIGLVGEKSRSQSVDVGKAKTVRS